MKFLFRSVVTRPAVWGLGFLLAGVMASTGALPAWVSIYFVAFVAFLLTTTLLLKKSRNKRYWPVLFFMVFFLAGAWRGTSRMNLYITEPMTGVFAGRVIDTGGLTAGGNQRAVVRLNLDGAQAAPQYARVKMYVRPHLPRVEIGQAVTLHGEILPLSRAVNPGGYDSFLHLRGQKMEGVLWPTYIATGQVQPSFFVQMRRVRNALSNVFDQVLPMREAGIIRSMVLGDREGLDLDLVEIYRVAGIRHVLSISGMHVTILTLFVNVLLGKFLEPRRAGLATLGIMILYCLMTGAAIATIRAVTMGGVLVFARVLYRDYDLLSAISVACAALLIYEPLMIFNVGFQLSFSAVYGIALLTAPLERLLALAKMPPYGKVRNAIAVSSAAAFSTYIIFAHHFYEIPLYSVLSNVLLLPFMLILLVMGVVTGLVGLVSISAAAVPAGVVFFILRLYESASLFVGGFPGALMPTGGGNLLVSLSAAAMLGAFAFVMHGFGEATKKRLPIFLFATAALMFSVYLHNFPLAAQTTLLQVHGGYITVERRAAQTQVIASPRSGENTLVRYLHRRNVRRVNYLHLSEWPRTQDISRFAAIFEKTQVLILPAPERRLPDALQQIVDENGITVGWGYIP
jgi:competence protein ComEC